MLVFLALSFALILQFACGGADPVRYRWVCPNNGRLARLAAPTEVVTTTLSATPETGIALWTPTPSRELQPVPFPTQDFGAPEPFLVATSMPVVATAPSPPVRANPTPDILIEAPALDDRTTQILGTATALSATATARAQGGGFPTSAGALVGETATSTPTPSTTPTPDEGGYP